MRGSFRRFTSGILCVTEITISLDFSPPSQAALLSYLSPGAAQRPRTTAASSAALPQPRDGVSTAHTRVLRQELLHFPPQASPFIVLTLQCTSSEFNQDCSVVLHGASVRQREPPHLLLGSCRSPRLSALPAAAQPAPPNRGQPQPLRPAGVLRPLFLCKLEVCSS